MQIEIIDATVAHCTGDELPRVVDVGEVVDVESYEGLTLTLLGRARPIPETPGEPDGIEPPAPPAPVLNAPDAPDAPVAPAPKGKAKGV